METILDPSAAGVFYDGLLTDPRLDLPEGLAVHRDGSVWCGEERGQIYRIEADGSSIEQVSSSAGFSHEMAHLFCHPTNLAFSVQRPVHHQPGTVAHKRHRHRG